MGVATSSAAQHRVQAPRGVLSGEVRDSLTGLAIAYPLVALTERSARTFGNEAGRFRFEGVRPGPVTVRLQQIGYRPTDVAVLVVDDPSAPLALSVALTKEELQLPEVVVTGDRGACAAPGLAATAGVIPIMDRVRANVDRIRALEQGYPFEITFDHTAVRANDDGQVIGKARRRTFVYSSKDLQGYRPGDVLDGAGRITLFTVSDVARDEFQRRHCFWYDGTDSLGARLRHRISFAPTTATRSPDWTGTLSIDAESALLVRADVRVTNLSDRSPITASNCVIEYGEIAPTLVLEREARCWTANRGEDNEVVLDQRRLLSHRFRKRKPGDP